MSLPAASEPGRTLDTIVSRNRQARRIAARKLGGHALSKVQGDPEAFVCRRCRRMDLLASLLRTPCEAA